VGKESKIILNPFCILIAFFKMIMTIIFIYYFSLVYSGWLLTVTGILGILWIMEGILTEWNMNIIKEKLEGKKK